MPKTTVWEKLRPIIKGVIEASLAEGQSLAAFCEERHWSYNQTWRNFYHANPPSPDVTRLFTFLSFALQKGNAKVQRDILRLLKTST